MTGDMHLAVRGGRLERDLNEVGTVSVRDRSRGPEHVPRGGFVMFTGGRFEDEVAQVLEQCPRTAVVELSLGDRRGTVVQDAHDNMCAARVFADTELFRER